MRQFFLCFLGGLAFAGSPEHLGSASKCRDELAFKNFNPTKKMREIDVAFALKETGKYSMRTLMQGGPIAQPKYFYQIIPRENWVEPGKKLKESPYSGMGARSGIESIKRALSNEESSMTPEDLIAQIVSGKIEVPLVYKPQNESWGSGIFFLFRDEMGHYRLSTQNDPKSPLKQSLDNQTLSPNVMSDNTMVEYEIPPERIEQVLSQVFKSKEGQEDGKWQLGIVEAYQPSWQYKGRAFETRVDVEGNIETGQIESYQPIAASIGNSPLMAGRPLFHREGVPKAPEFRKDSTFDPLIEAFVAPGLEEEFRAYVRSKIGEAFAYLAKRIRDQNILFNVPQAAFLQFDFLWLPPTKPGEFPTPFMPELHFSYSHPDMFKGNYNQLPYLRLRNPEKQ